MMHTVDKTVPSIPLTAEVAALARAVHGAHKLAEANGDAVWRGVMPANELYKGPRTEIA